MIKVILKDGSTMEIEEGTSILEVAKRISEGLARNVTCGEINGEIRDIRYKIKEIQIISNNGSIIKKIEDINLNNIKYIYEHENLLTETWYVIKVLQEDNKTAVSSPIFINHLNNYYN